MSSEITIITGHVGKEPEMRYLQDGKAVCNFSVAVNRRNGDVSWYRVSTWNKLAETCHQYVYKGMLVQVQGSVSARAWSDQKGQPQATLELTANTVDFLSRKDDGQGGSGDHPRGASRNNANQHSNTSSQQAADEPLFPSGDQSIPF